MVCANDMTVKHVIAGVSVDAKRRADEIWIQNSAIRASLVNIHRPKTMDVYQAKANSLMSPRHTGEERRVSQCSGHVYRLDLLVWQQQNAFNHNHYRIIVSLSR